MNTRLPDMETRGRDLALRLRAALDEQRLVSRFVDAYAKKYERAGLKESPLRYRELLVTLTREAWLALAARAESRLPPKISGRRGALRPSEAEAAGVFREAFLGEVGRLLQWIPSDREEFHRDLQLYAHIAARQPHPARAKRSSAAVEGAFVDRCALLLDPSLLEKARKAAGRFHLELEDLADKALQAIFRKPRKR